MNIKVELVMNNGQVDATATRAAFDTLLDSAVAQHSVETDTVAAAVNAVFDQHRGQAIKMPTLASLAATQLNADPSNFSSLSQLALDYIRSNKDGDNSLFVVRKGQNGGVTRRSDIASAPTA